MIDILTVDSLHYLFYLKVIGFILIYPFLRFRKEMKEYLMGHISSPSLFLSYLDQVLFDVMNRLSFNNLNL